MQAHQIVAALQERLLVVEERIGVHVVDTPKPGSLDWEFRNGALRNLRSEQEFLRNLIKKAQD